MAKRAVKVDLKGKVLPAIIDDATGVTSIDSGAAFTVMNGRSQRVFKIALLSYNGGGTSPHDINVINEIRRSSGRGNTDQVDRILIANGTPTDLGTGHKISFPYTTPGIERALEYIALNQYEVVVIPYGGQDNPYYQYYYEPLIKLGIVMVVGSGQGARDYSASFPDLPANTAAGMVLVSSTAANQDFGKGMEMRIVAPDQGTFTGALTQSQSTGVYGGAMVGAMASGRTPAEARAYLRSLAGTTYTVQNGFGIVNWTAPAIVPLPSGFKYEFQVKELGEA